MGQSGTASHINLFGMVQPRCSEVTMLTKSAAQGECYLIEIEGLKSRAQIKNRDATRCHFQTMKNLIKSSKRESYERKGSAQVQRENGRNL
jgi:hypothetical protein